MTKQKANFMCKYVNTPDPVYLCNMFTPRTLSFDLRDTRKKLYLPKPRYDYLKHSFNYSGAALWKDLPEELRPTGSLGFFKTGFNKINGSLHRTPTQQICKPADRKFYTSCMFSFYYNTDIFTVF